MRLPLFWNFSRYNTSLDVYFGVFSCHNVSSISVVTCYPCQLYSLMGSHSTSVVYGTNQLLLMSWISDDMFTQLIL